MTDYQNTTVRTEIATIRSSNPDADILVSISENGEAKWGEASALEHDKMTEAMTSIGFSTTGMLTAEQFEARF